MNTVANDLLYLLRCALHGQIPAVERIAAMDLQQLYKLCQFHSLTAMVCMALESAGADIPAEWQETKAKAIRKIILLDAEREKIFQYMESQGIWHMPLKGILLKEFYPAIGMRQMSDNDILYDATYQKQLCRFMQAQNYTAVSVGKCHHDTYQKPPIYNIELHTQLFEKTGEIFYTYYQNVRERLLPVEGKPYTLQFTDEDFYIYMTAHEYKHFHNGGTGLRSLTDGYLYTRAKSLDWAYIRKELETLGIADFAEERLALAEAIFSRPAAALTEKQQQLLKYYLFSGTYGTMEHVVQNRRQGEPLAVYLWRRIFPDKKFYQAYYPTFYRYHLLPLAWIFRLVRGVTVRGKRLRTELQILRKS